MPFRKSLVGVLATFLIFTTIPIHAQAKEASNDRILHAVDEHYNHLNSLRTRYIETYKGVGLTRMEYGALLLKKPGRMRWAYDIPKGKVFILDGKYAWFYTPGDDQAQRIPAKQMDDMRTPLRFLLGHTQLKKELDHIAVLTEADGFRITGVPKGMGNRIKQLTLRVTEAGVITDMKVEEIDGASTEFQFSDSTENVPLDDREFVFTAPPGVAIVDGMPPI